MKKNPWNFAFKGSVIAICLFIVIFIVAYLTRPKEIIVGTEGLVNYVVIFLTGILAAVIILTSFAVSVTRAVLSERHLQPKERIDPKTKEKSKALTYVLVLIIFAICIFVYFYTTDFNGPKPGPVNENFNTLPEVDISYRSGQLQ